jgi:hypothetical protein
MVWALVTAGARPLRDFLRVGALRTRSGCFSTQIGNSFLCIARSGTATVRFGVDEDLAHTEC